MKTTNEPNRVLETNTPNPPKAIGFQPQLWLAVGLLGGLFLHGVLSHWSGSIGLLTFGKPVVAATLDDAVEGNALPAADYRGAPIPDFERISFGSLPPLESDGWVELSDGTVMSWQAGQLPGEVLTLGGFEDAFGLGQFDLQSIAAITGTALDGVSLEEFAPVASQTIGDLVAAIPTLEAVVAIDIPPVADLLAEFVPQVDLTRPLSDAIANFPQVEFLSLDLLPNLGDYNLLDIPGIELAPLAEFKNWQDALLQDIPGLLEVPLSEFPTPPILHGTLVGKVGIAFEEAEREGKRSISGGYSDGFEVNCQGECPHVEFDAPVPLEGKRWMTGDHQVRGGFGLLGAMYDDKEPAGRHPFGSGFKVVLETHEASGTVRQNLYFQICGALTGCTGYNIGPIPFWEFLEEEWMFLGGPDLSAIPELTNLDDASNLPGDVLDTISQLPQETLDTISQLPQETLDAIFQLPQEASNQLASVPDALVASLSKLPQEVLEEVAQLPPEVLAQISQLPQEAIAGLSGSKSPPPNENTAQIPTTTEVQQIDVQKLSEALVNVEGQLVANGDYGWMQSNCLGGNNEPCEVLLGRYHLSSQDEGVRAAIRGREGGSSALHRLDAGFQLTREEIEHVLPPERQDRLFETHVSQLIEVAQTQIDPKTEQPFEGTRLIERVARMFFGGEAIPVEGEISLLSGTLGDAVESTLALYRG